MEPTKLAEENYHSTEMRKKFMGFSQFKDFLECPKKALAKINGEVPDEKTEALLVGSYVDAYFSGTLETFKRQNPEIFKKDGTLKAPFLNAENVIKAVESDEILYKYYGGEHQVIMTGEIAGVPFKIKIDNYFPGKVIVDEKVMASLGKVWIEKEDENGFARNYRVDFVEAYRYDLEGAIYREIVRQNTGETLPFVLAVVTKEESPDKALIEIDSDILDAALEEVKEKAPIFQQMKEGLMEPDGCDKCSVCRSEKKIQGVKLLSKIREETENG